MKQLSPHKTLLILAVIILVGAFLRLYHLSDWMHYELDQARDYRIIHTAIEHGSGELPLQGPRASGNVTISTNDSGDVRDETTLRLGPLFYYLGYGSALIFGDTPIGSIMILVILSIATIPLFFVFVREFFDDRLALGLTSIVSVSLFFVTYSRFGWNPNLMPFFMILFAYGLLRATAPAHTAMHRGWWLIMASGALAFLSNMHFLAFIIAPIIGVAFLVWARPRINWRYWTGAIMLLVFLNTPLVVNDVMTRGENTRALITSLQSSGSSDHGIIQKITQNMGLHSKYLWIVITGDQRAELPMMVDGGIVCDYDCRNGVLRGALATLIIISGAMGLLWFYHKETNHRRKNFLRIVVLWGSVTFVVYTPLAFDIAPRFFLLNAPLFIIILGFIVHAGFKRGKKRDYILGYLVIGLAIIINLVFVGLDFAQRDRASSDATMRLERADYILKEKARITLGQIEAIVADMVAMHTTNGYPIYNYIQPEYRRSFAERIDTRGIARKYIPKDLSQLYRKGNYFLIIRTQSDQDRYLTKFSKGFIIQEKKVFGTLTLYHVIPKESAIISEREVFAPVKRDPRFGNNTQVRYLWRQVFEGCRYDYKSNQCEKN